MKSSNINTECAQSGPYWFGNVFQTIRETAKLPIGLTEHALRVMRKNGELPGRPCGNRFMVNVPELLKLNSQSEKDR